MVPYAFNFLLIDYRWNYL